MKSFKRIYIFVPHPFENRYSLFIEPTEAIAECRDPKDNKYLELAVAGQAECIITGDQDLLVLHPFKGIDILTVQEFLATDTN